MCLLWTGMFGCHITSSASLFHLWRCCRYYKLSDCILHTARTVHSTSSFHCSADVTVTTTGAVYSLTSMQDTVARLAKPAAMPQANRLAEVVHAPEGVHCATLICLTPQVSCTEVF